MVRNINSSVVLNHLYLNSLCKLYVASLLKPSLSWSSMRII